MTPEAIKAVAAHAAKFVGFQRGNDGMVAIYVTGGLKAAIQMIAGMAAAGKLVPCPRCEKDGVSRGRYRQMDASGSDDEIECDLCHGWTVVEAKE